MKIDVEKLQPGMKCGCGLFQEPLLLMDDFPYAFTSDDIAVQVQNIRDNDLSSVDGSLDCHVSDDFHTGEECFFRNRDITSDREQWLVTILELHCRGEDPFWKDEFIYSERFTAVAGEAGYTIDLTILSCYFDFTSSGANSAGDDLLHLSILFYVDCQLLPIREVPWTHQDFFHFSRIHLEGFF